MFLRKTGYSKRYTFDVIYSALQKFMRRGMKEEAIEMCKEFHDYPNALRKRLVYCICEDCPDLDLVYKVFSERSTSPEHIKNLVKYVPVICDHMKSREIFYHCYYLAATGKYSKEPLSIKDDQETMLSKIVYGLAHERELEMIEFFQKHIALVPLKRIFTFSGKNRCFIYTLAAYFLKPHLREKCVLRDVPITFDFDANFVMPDYVYDKHVHGGTKGYAFFVNNIVMIPVEPESEVAREAKKICIESECNTGHWLSELAKKT